MMIIENPTVFRDNLKNKFLEFIKKEDVSINLEKGIFNYTISEAKKKKIVRKWTNKNFVQIYINRFRSVYSNIHPKSKICNKTLLKKLKNKKLSPKKLAFMSHQEMSPKKWKELIEAKIKRDKNLTEVDMSAATDEFKCYKCQKRLCTYYQLQTRSADEPMTTFITCLNCGNRWKN
tara:strand:- start:39 stop:566 length:528 start_codon:yes stop_codon:yes gene_type:complete